MVVVVVVPERAKCVLPIEIIGLESSLCHVIGVHYVKSKW